MTLAALIFFALAAAARAQALPTEMRWSVALAEQPATPPVIAGDLVFIALKSGAVAAYRAADGAEVWRVDDLPTAVPLATDGARVFVASGQAIYAFNADRSPAWHTDAGTLTAPMLVDDGWVVAAAGAQLTAYRANDGSIVWRQELKGVIARPAIEGGTLYLSLDDGRVVALDLQTGKQKWQRPLGGAPTEVLAFSDHVFAGSADKHFYCLDAEDGKIAWKYFVGSPVRGRAEADAERVYIVALDNALRAFDRGNGALRWSPRGIPFRPTAGPVLAGALIAVAGTTNEIRAFSAATGQPAGQVSFPASLAMLPDYATTGAILSIAAATGSLTQEWKLSLAVSGTIPTVPVEPLTVLPGESVPIPTPPSR